jgi:N-acetylglucosaminyldiphosphoundecaprenol N-acetyl-beta-D-mannosaminyltransferase
MKQLILGMPIDALTMDDVLDRCRTSLASRERTLVGVVNAAKMVRLRHDAHLRDSLLECDLLLADGQSVVWASRLLRRRVPERVAGVDLFERLLELAARDGWSVYLLGARADVLATLQQRLGERFPALKIAGARDGYFTDAEAPTVAADITGSGADMLFLGVTSPKKEIFLGDYGETLGVPVLHGVGGSFDILAGVTKRAPQLWQRLGLEWLYRVLQEPRRLWRRYFTTNATFIALVLRELVRRQPPYRHSSGE